MIKLNYIKIIHNYTALYIWFFYLVYILYDKIMIWYDKIR
jgi:hypothetical protein